MSTCPVIKRFAKSIEGRSSSTATSRIEGLTVRDAPIAFDESRHIIGATALECSDTQVIKRSSGRRHDGRNV